MASNSSPFRRPQGSALLSRLAEPRRFIEVVAGARQVGKTTLVQQVAAESGIQTRIVTADEPTLRGRGWLEQQWEISRLGARDSADQGALLVIDEVQKAPDWSETVKRLWDDDTATGTPLKVVLLGSAPILMQQGMTESLAGRFELIHLPHWSFGEMKSAFGWSLDQYLFFGAYPGAAPLINQPDRWARYIRDSLIETTIARDVLLMTRVAKPALLRRLFELGTSYSGQILSYTKMLGQLQDAGNATTLAHYLDLLEGAGMLTGLQKYAGDRARRRGSSPKLQVLNTALMTALSGMTLEQARKDPDYWGRLTESAVGAHLANAAAQGTCKLFYWRERDREVDFVVRKGRSTTAIEVQSSCRRHTRSGMDTFAAAFSPERNLLVGGDGIELEEFLLRPVTHWIAA